MMEIIRETHTKPSKSLASVSQASNDNRRKRLAFGRSVFPEDVGARIFRPSHSVMTSGKARMNGWLLVFERRSAPFIEPLMGYTGTTDTLTQVELEFPTLRSAIRYAERQGLTYVVQGSASKAAALTKKGIRRRLNRPSHALSDATLERLGLAALQESYGQAMVEAAERHDASGPATWSSPIDVIRDPTLSLEAKRSILMNWAWIEYLIDQATNEGMPVNNRPSRLNEVEQALLALEGDVERRQDRTTADRKAA
ncbi:NADH dehydrogenase ubiquinone Fe-S protein 4 [Rhizobium sp. SG741]|uniref:NADH dehydrogenase ubiquinone Fe-S protein 4 n=1 Tax=Rhizobium sp. SG741 TaxID=2587114 RepID=UPI00144785B4|nr:NADH dehydrogenase ubiquinone Fe-S protein 4 [Rhizobium sp. SG741]